jgi:hypothetical protein
MGWSGGGSVNIDDATLIRNAQGQIAVNLANSNTWVAQQIFTKGISVQPTYIPITFTNSQSSATSTNFQVYVSVNLAPYSSFINPNLTNLYFSSDAEGTQVLTSWRESGTSNIGTASWWVLLPNGIAANSSITIYLRVDNIANNDWNTTTTGVAPYLTSTYAQYDNGANVFNYYQRFGSLSALPSGWTETNTNISYDTDYIALSPTTGGSNGGVYTTTIPSSASTSSSWAFDMMMSATQSGTNTNIWMGGLFTSADFGTGNGPNNGYTTGIWQVSGNSYYNFYVDSVQGIEVSTPTNQNIYSLLFSSTNSYSGLFNYGNSISSTNSYSVNVFGLFSYPEGNTSANLYWIRARAYPPNGVMPSVSVGSLTIM